MRTTPALRTLAAILLTGGTFAAATAGTTAAAATPPTYADGQSGSGGSGGPIWGTIVSGTALNVRAAPTTHSAVVDRLAPGSQDRVECKVRGQSVNGNPYWYWLVGTQGWVSADFVDTSGHVPTCSDPCPEWKNDGWNNADWNDPDWNESWAVSSSGSWAVSGSGSGSWSASGSWSFSASGSSSGGWEWLPAD